MTLIANHFNIGIMSLMGLLLFSVLVCSSWWLLTKALAATDDTTNAEALAATAATLYAQ
jgi:hypothetical protein